MVDLLTADEITHPGAVASGFAVDPRHHPAWRLGCEREVWSRTRDAGGDTDRDRTRAGYSS